MKQSLSRHNEIAGRFRTRVLAGSGFLAAAFLLAITPGPGIFYVLTRTLTGGTQEGVLSSLGTFLGGLIHVIAAALGLSAILSTSASAFLIVKYVGAIYLIWIGNGVRALKQDQEKDLKATGRSNCLPG